MKLAYQLIIYCILLIFFFNIFLDNIEDITNDCAENVLYNKLYLFIFICFITSSMFILDNIFGDNSNTSDYILKSSVFRGFLAMLGYSFYIELFVFDKRCKSNVNRPLIDVGENGRMWKLIFSVVLTITSIYFIQFLFEYN